MELRDLWLQKEGSDGRLAVRNSLGSDNLLDSMIKVWTSRDVDHRLCMMSAMIRYGSRVFQLVVSGGSQGYSLVGPHGDKQGTRDLGRSKEAGLAIVERTDPEVGLHLRLLAPTSHLWQH